MWRAVTIVALTSGLLVLIALAGRSLLNTFKPERNQIESKSAPSIDSIREAGDLIVLRVPVTDLREVSVSGYLGGQSALLLIRGVVEVGVDLRDAKYRRLDDGTCVAKLELPQPRVVAAYIDHETSRVHSITRHGTWFMAMGDAAARRLIDEGFQGAQAELNRFRLDADLMSRAQGYSERLLGRQFDSVGWRLEVVWK